jgi:hypothetical protein
MNLSSDLIREFVKVTNDEPQKKLESTTYGTAVKVGNSVYVRIDGSDQLLSPTPVTNSTADIKDGDRVAVTIKNHTATITGNLTSPSARVEDTKATSEEVKELGNKVSEFDNIIADVVTAEQLAAESARIDALVAKDVTIDKKLEANEASIKELEVKDVSIEGTLSANSADISTLKTNKLDAAVAESKYATIENLKATNTEVYNFKATYSEFTQATAENFTAVDADIQRLDAEKLSSDDAEITYANIDFSNIDKAAIEEFFSKSGLIENLTVGDQTITGYLVGVTIRGDLIEGNTIVADKLVIRGEDGLYYKLNTDGVSLEEEQTDENSLNGTVIQAKSITASKVNVSDLVAFDATIGGFHITDNAIYSEVKDSSNNVTRGIYMDTDGQINFGDSSNFVRYYKDTDGSYKLSISAASILYALDGKQYSIADLGQIGDYIHIGTYENEPCIELGESDSDFKLVITNTRILFMEGADVPAYINNQSLHIKTAVIEEELQQGNFVWKIRSNGNMGLVWKGEA